MARARTKSWAKRTPLLFFRCRHCRRLRWSVEMGTHWGPGGERSCISCRWEAEMQAGRYAPEPPPIRVRTPAVTGEDGAGDALIDEIRRFLAEH